MPLSSLCTPMAPVAPPEDRMESGSPERVRFEHAVEEFVVARLAFARPDARVPFDAHQIVAVPGLRRAVKFLVRRYLPSKGPEWVGEVMQRLVAWMLGAEGVRRDRGATIIGRDAAKLIALFPGMTTENAIRARVLLKAREIASDVSRRKALGAVPLTMDVEDPRNVFEEIDRRLDAGR